jgi:hypothetical protein
MFVFGHKLGVSFCFLAGFVKADKVRRAVSAVREECRPSFMIR